MGTILSAILAVFGTLWAAICKILAGVPSGAWMILIAIGFGVWLGWGGCTGCSCRRPRPPRPPKEWQCDVVSVPTGASIEVTAGLLGRKTHTIALAYIAAPTAQPWADDSAASLADLAGKTIRVVEVNAGKQYDSYYGWTQAHLKHCKECKWNWFEGAYEHHCPESAAMEDVYSEPPEARVPVVGICYGESGAELGLAQVEAGLAKCQSGAPQSYCDSQNAARKAKRGQWGKP
jgi:endonuclease YncB( thermonuclease family)